MHRYFGATKVLISPLHPLEVDWKGTSGSVRLCIAAASLIRIYTNILKKAMLH
jgi:hypothetical protein